MRRLIAKGILQLHELQHPECNIINVDASEDEIPYELEKGSSSHSVGYMVEDNLKLDDISNDQVVD